MKQIITTLLPLLLITGCAASNYYMAGGDRAGGSVTMVCNYDIVTPCKDDVTTDMMNKAKETCARWGYESAMPFGGIRNAYNPNTYSGTKEIAFQCLGDLEL